MTPEQIQTDAFMQVSALLRGNWTSKMNSVRRTKFQSSLTFSVNVLEIVGEKHLRERILPAGVDHSPGISSLGGPLTRVRTGKSDRARSPICRQCGAFMERPFVALEDVRNVVSVSQGSQRVPIGQPAIEVDFAVSPVELPKVIGDSRSLPFQPSQAGRCRLRFWYRRRVVRHSPTLGAGALRGRSGVGAKHTLSPVQPFCASPPDPRGEL
jgi:hypothetical protein